MIDQLGGGWALKSVRQGYGDDLELLVKYPSKLSDIWPSPDLTVWAIQLWLVNQGEV